MKSWSLLIFGIGTATGHGSVPLAVEIENLSSGCQTTCQCYMNEIDSFDFEPTIRYDPPYHSHGHNDYYPTINHHHHAAQPDVFYPSFMWWDKENIYGGRKHMMNYRNVGIHRPRKGKSGHHSESGKGRYGKGEKGKSGEGKGGKGKGRMGKGKGRMGKGGKGMRRDLETRNPHHSAPTVRCECSCDCPAPHSHNFPHSHTPVPQYDDFYYGTDDYGTDDYEPHHHGGHDHGPHSHTPVPHDDFVTYDDDDSCCGYEEICDYVGGSGGMFKDKSGMSMGKGRHGGGGWHDDDSGADDHWSDDRRYVCQLLCVVPCGGNPYPRPAPVPKPVPRPLPRPIPRPMPVPRPVPRPIPRPAPIPRPVPRPSPQPVAAPRPIPAPVDDEVCCGYQEVCDYYGSGSMSMGMGGEGGHQDCYTMCIPCNPIPFPVPRPVPQPVYRPVPQPVYRPVPQPVYRPVPQPVYRPVPAPTQECCGYEKVCDYNYEGGSEGSMGMSMGSMGSMRSGGYVEECYEVCIPCGPQPVPQPVRTQPVPVRAPRPVPVPQPIRDDPISRPVPRPVPQPVQPPPPVPRPVPRTFPPVNPPPPIRAPVPVPQPVQPVPRPVPQPVQPPPPSPVPTPLPEPMPQPIQPPPPSPAPTAQPVRLPTPRPLPQPVSRTFPPIQQPPPTSQPVSLVPVTMPLPVPTPTIPPLPVPAPISNPPIPPPVSPPVSPPPPVASPTSQPVFLPPSPRTFPPVEPPPPTLSPLSMPQPTPRPVIPPTPQPISPRPTSQPVVAPTPQPITPPPTLQPVSPPSSAPLFLPPPVPAPFCGDGIVDPGEQCDDGANGDDTDGCTDECSFCVCSATAEFDASSGAVDIEFNYCGEADPDTRDWIGIYPCDAPTKVTTQEWWDEVVCGQFRDACGADPMEFGYSIGQAYVDVEPTWFGYTCGPPLDPELGGCQVNRFDVGFWPSEGRYRIDPNMDGARWAFPGGRTLEPGCYKAVLHRYAQIISPPPYPIVCAPWVDSPTFTVPALPPVPATVLAPVPTNTILDPPMTPPPVVTPFCGDGIVDAGEQCDDGANGDDTDGCKDDCTVCVCSARAEYDVDSGVLDVAFDYCGAATPEIRDWIGIYPCDAPTNLQTQEWWDDTVCPQFLEACGASMEEFGYRQGEEYVDVEPLWFGYTCGPPLDPESGGCQIHRSDVRFWPSIGRYRIDPNMDGADWAFPGGRTLPSGCYKVVLNRYANNFSAPPYATVCAPWVDAPTFVVP